MCPHQMTSFVVTEVQRAASSHRLCGEERPLARTESVPFEFTLAGSPSVLARGRFGSDMAWLCTNRHTPARPSGRGGGAGEAWTGSRPVPIRETCVLTNRMFGKLMPSDGAIQDSVEDGVNGHGKTHLR